MKTPDPDTLRGSFRPASDEPSAEVVREAVARVIVMFSEQAALRDRPVNWRLFRVWPEAGALCMFVPMA